MAPELSPEIVARILARHSIGREKGSHIPAVCHDYMCSSQSVLSGVLFLKDTQTAQQLVSTHG